MAMNLTLQKFDYPGQLLKEYEHWVVLLRPVQLTLGCVIIAAKSDVTSLGALQPAEMAELPRVIGEFEALMRDGFGAEKFNYLALMMVDPNPHFHAIPRYKGPVAYGGQTFEDSLFPKAPQLDVSNPCTAALLQALRTDLHQRYLD